MLRYCLFVCLLPLCGCSSSGPVQQATPATTTTTTTTSNATQTGAIDLGGTWTVVATSTQGQRGLSGTATVAQIGQGVGIDGTTTLTAPIGQLVISQAGTALSGTITNTLSSTAYSFTGSLSNGAFSVTGSTVCARTKVSEVTLITGNGTSTNIQGSYTVSRNGCSFSDAGTFVATKR